MYLALLLVTLGAAIALLERIVAAKEKTSFTWPLFWAKNLYLNIYNAIIGISVVIAVYASNPLIDFKINGYDVTMLIWLLTGFMALYLWKLLINGYKYLAGKFIPKK